MKRCPECRRDYYDDTLSFCLEDGTPLVYGLSPDEPATAILSEPGAVATGFRRDGESSESKTAIQSHTEAEPQRVMGDLAERQSLSAHQAAKPLGRFGGRKGLFLISCIAVLIVVAGFFGYRYFTPASSKQIESIAVMPFVNDSGNPDIEYLSDGMTETLISSLTQLPNLNVKARSSVFRYKGKETDAKTIGKELNVQAILTGRIATRGDQLTLSLELVDVQTENAVWSQQYNRKQTDLVSLQAEIARDVSSKIKTKLSGADQQKLAKNYTASSGAYQLYLRGRFYWNKRTAENIRKAMEQFQQAADADPNYALAYAGLADCYVVLGDYTGAPETETVPKVQAFAKRALALDSSLVEAQTSLAYSYAQVWQWTDSEREFKRAIEIDPNYPTAHHWYNLLLMETGRFTEGLAEIKRAQELDPLSMIISYGVALSLLATGDVNGAMEQSKKIIDLDPNFPRAHQALGYALLKQNRHEEAIAEFRRAADLSPNDRLSLRDLGYGYAIAQKRDDALAVLKQLKANYEKGEAYPQDVAAVYAGLGDKDQAFAWLEKSFETRTGRLSRIGYHVPFESLRGDPRYADLRRRMGLPQ